VSTRHAVRTQLEGRLANLLRRAGKIEGNLKQAHDRDSEERATELKNDKVLEGLDEMTLEEIRQIRTALKHIESGATGCARPAAGRSVPSVWQRPRARSRASRARDSARQIPRARRAISLAASREGHVHVFPALQHEHVVRALVSLGVGHLEETEIAAHRRQ